MSTQLRIPDIGDFDSVDVVELLVAEGDLIENGQEVLTLESDKASMEVPASEGGRLVKWLVKVGDKVKEGDVIAELEPAAGASTPAEKPAAEASAPVAPAAPAPSSAPVSTAVSAPAAGGVKDLVVPDIGDFEAVNVIDVMIKVGDTVEKEQSLITLESDKAAMDVPALEAGEVIALSVKVGDQVSEGTVIGQIRLAASAGGGAAPATSPAANIAPVEVSAPVSPAPVSAPAVATPPAAAPAVSTPAVSAPATPAAQIDEAAFAKAYASPSVRKFARELGADLGRIKGSGRKGRIVEADVKAFVKAALSAPPPAAAVAVGSGIPPIPAVDFSKFGPVETQKLSRINVLTGEAMTRCWLNVPAVTQHDLADITELEAFRKSLKTEAEKRGVRVTMLSFLMKALAKALVELPRFNSSLSPDGKSLILKKYFHIGIAVDTPNGLVVPVIRDVDKKGIYELSQELMTISKKARDGKLSPADMQGASMTISSLGGIGGTYFTPIVNAPEVAILGVSRSTLQPVWNGKEFAPRLMLPLSLSYDHRVIDGALGARMTVLLGQLLADMKRTLL